MKSKKLRIRIMMLVVIAMICSTLNIQTYAAEGESVNAYVQGDSVVITYDGPWDYYFGQRFEIALEGADLAQNLSSVVVNQGMNDESGSVTVLDSWSSGISGASGSYSCNGPAGDNGKPYSTVHYELVIPISVYGTPSVVSVSYNGSSFSLPTGLGGEDPAPEDPAPEDPTPEDPTPEDPTPEDPTPEDPTPEDPTPEDPTPEDPMPEDPTPEKPTPDPKPTPSDQGPGVSGKLTVDGFYSDWTPYEPDDMTYHNNNNNSNHKANIVVEDGRVFIHFKTADNYATQLQVGIMTLDVDGQKVALEVMGLDGNGNLSGIPIMSNGTYTNFGMRINYVQANDCQVAFTVYDDTHSPTTEGDECELSFSLEELEKITGIKAENISKLTVSNPNLGGETSTWVGTPTGAVLGVIAMLIIAAVGLYIWKKQNEKENV